MDPALVVAIVAIVVSALAAGFTGWQAVTVHLARTTSRKASFVVSRDGDRPHEPWMLVNTGGSVAVDVVVTAFYPLPSDPALRTLVGRAVGPAYPEKPVPLKGTENRGFGGTRLRPKVDEPGKWEKVPDGVHGGRYSMKKYATVEWRDYRGRWKTGRIRMR